MKNYDTYLFDADGTLFDTIDLICNCFQYVAGKYTGKTLAREKIIRGIGLPLFDQIAHHMGDSADHTMIADDYRDYQMTILETSVSLFPDVPETLQALKNAGKQLGIVTSRKRPSLELMLSATGTENYFDVLVTPEDTGRHKPHAEPVLKAMALLKAEKARTVFIGDALYDICSGAEAGVDTVFVTWSHSTLASLPIPPTWIIDRVREIMSPPALG
jgi:pyrophosphatase PpaX